MVATRRSADNRSRASDPSERQAPLNSSIPAMRLRISGVISTVFEWILGTNLAPIYTHSARGSSLIGRVLILKLCELGRHSLVPLGQFLYRYVLCLVVGKTKISIGTEQRVLGFLQVMN